MSEFLLKISEKVFAKDLYVMMMSSAYMRPIQSQFDGINQKRRKAYLSEFIIFVISLYLLYTSGYINNRHFQKKHIKRVRIWWNLTFESTCH